MEHVVAIVAAAGRGTHAVLAREALRKAAEARGIDLAIETRGPEGISDPLPPDRIARAERLLLVGDPGPGDLAPALAALPTVRATLDEVLADAAGVLARGPAAAQAERAVEAQTPPHTTTGEQA